MVATQIHPKADGGGNVARGATLRLRRIAEHTKAAELLAIVASDANVATDLMLSPCRESAVVARARQVFMYLMHVALGLGYVEIGVLVGRDRSTVAYACGVIEDLRDDAAFDAQLNRLESLILAEPAVEQNRAQA